MVTNSVTKVGIVRRLTDNCGLLRIVGSNLAARRYRLSYLLLLLVLVGSTIASRAEAHNFPITSVELNPQFAINDLDGDLRPDTASIETQQSGPSHTQYRIELRLSAIGRQSISVLGPDGGLQIEARDVNGDHAVDLVLSTAWHKQPVAILLNDGHRKFSQIEPNAFPGAFNESGEKWRSITDEATDAVGVPLQSRTQLELGTIVLPQFCHIFNVAHSGFRFQVRDFFPVPSSSPAQVAHHSQPHYRSLTR